MTFARRNSGCSSLIMEAQTVGLINCEGLTLCTRKSFCHAKALSREHQGLRSQILWHALPPQLLSHHWPGSHDRGLGRDEREHSSTVGHSSVVTLNPLPFT